VKGWVFAELSAESRLASLDEDCFLSLSLTSSFSSLIFKESF